MDGVFAIAGAVVAIAALAAAIYFGLIKFEPSEKPAVSNGHDSSAADLPAAPRLLTLIRTGVDRSGDGTLFIPGDSLYLPQIVLVLSALMKGPTKYEFAMGWKAFIQSEGHPEEYRELPEDDMRQLCGLRRVLIVDVVQVAFGPAAAELERKANEQGVQL